MMAKWFLVITMSSILWTTCLSDNECTSIISNTTEIIFTCLSNVVIDELPLYNYTTGALANITSIVVNGLNDTSAGPFTSIPPNICLLPNLMSIDFSYNLIQQVDPAGVLSACLTKVITLDVSYNNISQFPSAMIYHMPTLKNLYFQHNQLIDVPGNAFLNVSNLEIIDFSYNDLTNFELWAIQVAISADFSYNQISMITNKYFYDIPPNTSAGQRRTFYLDNNGPSINLTDGIYEMYNSCGEVIQELGIAENDGSIIIPGLSYNLAFINFGTTQINCSCDQSYIIQMFISTFARIADMATFPIYNTTCIGGAQQFVYSTCPSGSNPSNSSVDFSQVYPRQCKIRDNESGNLTTAPSITIPTANVSTYPHYATELMNPGACFFTFFNSTSARIKCTTDLSNSSTIPSDLLSSTYFSGITHIDFTYSISSLPSYLCTLPSRSIDLSFQSFTTLSDATFPCLDWFHTVSLAYNQLTSVNMSSGNFTNLNSLDLSSNRLTQLPYSILTPTPSSLRYLDLRNNSITSIDLFLYTLKNITVDLRDNPINTSSIIDPQNVTLPSGYNITSTINITFSSSVTNSTYIFNDQTALTAGTCDANAILMYRDILRSTFNNVLLDCSCASITVKEIFLRSGLNVTDDFNCTNGTSAASFYNLTMSSCGSSALNFSTGLCYNASLQSFSDNTSLTNLIISNQQHTNSPAFEGSGFDRHTLQISNTSNQLPAIYFETIISENSSDVEVTSALSVTASPSNRLIINNTTAQILDDSMMTDMDWTTTTTTTTTSTTTSTSTSTSTTSTSATTSSTSASTSTSSSTTTTSVTTTSTSTTSTTKTSTTSATTTSTSTTSTTRTSTTSATTTSTSTTSTTTTSTTSTTTTSTTSTTTTSTTSTTTTSTTTTSVTTTTTISNISSGIVQSNSGTSDSNSNRNGLIIGVVVGSVAFFALLGGAIAAWVIKGKAASGAATINKPVGRAVVANQAPKNGHLPTRNFRSVRLAPLPTQPSKLPPSSTTANPSALSKSDLSTPLRGIPLRLDPIRSPSSITPQYAPNSTALNSSFNFHPINNPSTVQRSLTQQQFPEPKGRQPRLNHVLNVGGDTIY